MTRASDSRLSDLQVTLATPLDLAEVHGLLESAGQRLAERGFPNWLPPYPRDRLLTDIEEQIVRAVRDGDGGIVATFMLRDDASFPYFGIAWADDSAAACYLRRLAVRPERHGQGIGSWCLTHVDAVCAALGHDAVRCDVLQANVPLRRFYERHGYERRGERYHSGWHFTVYEKVLGSGG